LHARSLDTVLVSPSTLRFTHLNPSALNSVLFEPQHQPQPKSYHDTELAWIGLRSTSECPGSGFIPNFDRSKLGPGMHGSKLNLDPPSQISAWTQMGPG